MNRKLNSIVRFLFRREKVESELDRELQYHEERLTERNLAHGMAPDEARRQATIAVGGHEALKDDCRDARVGRLVETLGQDLRYGVRVLMKNPGFSVAAILTLALGIGANTAIFSLVYGVLLRPLPYGQGDQLVVLHQDKPKAQQMDNPFAVQEIVDYGKQNHTLQGVVEHHTMNFLLMGKDTAERVETAVVSANFFDVLGVKPILGRAFVKADDVLGAPAVLILSYKYWQSHQSGDPNIVGKIFQMNNRPHTVIGVLPSFPQYPTEVDVYMPTSQCPSRSSARFISNRKLAMMTAFARLKPGVTVEQAQADLSVVANGMVNAHPDVYTKSDGYRIGVAPLQDDLTRRARTMFLVLLAVAGFVLLIACANVANLLLARLLKLERELALRAALGASKMRLLRQLLTESVLLSVAGGALGLACAPFALALLNKFAERFTTRAAEVRIDAPVLLFTLVVSVATGILFGLAPALFTGSWLGRAFQQAGGRTTAGRGRQALRAALVVAQVAVSVILLTGAGLMIRSFNRLAEVKPGFVPDRLVTLRVSPGFPPYNGQTARLLLDKLLVRVKGVGGVESLAMASGFPFNPASVASGPIPNSYIIQGKPLANGQPHPNTALRVVTADYFRAIRQPIVKGRGFTLHDEAADSPQVVIINQALARGRFPDEDPIGKRISFDDGEHWQEIVGIAGDVTEFGLDHPMVDEIYGPMHGNGFVGWMVVRTTSDPKVVTPLVRAAIREVDPMLAIDRVDTVERAEYDSMASPRVMTFLLGLFACLAVAISASGLAAVLALSVSQRTREIGVRMALGAKRGWIVGMVVRQGLLLAGAGVVVGLAGAAGLTRLLAGLLYGTSPTDVPTFGGVMVLFLVVAAGACFVPARQVTAIDPLIALREE